MGLLTPENITIIKVSGRDCASNPLLDNKLFQFSREKYNVRYSDYGSDSTAKKNRTITRWLEEDSTDYLVAIDADQVWLDVTDPMLATDGDIVYATYVDQSGHLAHNGEFGCGCFRISRLAAKKITTPWFASCHDVTGATQQICECAYFTKKARAAGFEPVAVGAIGHIVSYVLVPESGKIKMKLLNSFER